ncbi:hypothetical protein BC834DRAFT_889064 [Gloeopeniophorella convolvens]|nr:hypothetical protein BC834DRAFT_889064 [Gloeopeniophorella convolvens]
MADHAGLNSHPSLVRPPDSKSLKRSASVASLPTPPRTVRKRSRSRSSAYLSSDDEADGVLPVVSPNLSPSGSHRVPEEPVAVSHKRRRIDAVVAELNAEDGEDAFWLAGAPSQPPAPTKPKPKSSRSSRPVSKGKPPSSARRGAPTSSRRLSQSRAVPAPSAPSTWSLLSPPPTRPRPPVTPPRRRPAKPMPVRDSPNNPFLVGPSDSPGSLPSSPAGPRTPQPDRETLSYIFRGKRIVFQNPHFGVPRDPRSTLPADHPDFSPSEDCTPRRLFGPPARKGKAKAEAPASPTPKALKGRSPSPGLDNEDEDDDDGLGPPPRASLAHEFARISKAEGKVARALSPVREATGKAEVKVRAQGRAGSPTPLVKTEIAPELKLETPDPR